MSVLRRLALVVLLSAGLITPVAAETDTRWACWYQSESLTIQCLLAQAPSWGHEMRAAEVARSIDERLPKLVATIWGSPETLGRQRVSIPLHAPPFEMDYVAELAVAVMCGARLDCSASLDLNVDGQAPVRAAALRSGADEALIMAELTRQGFVLLPSTLPVQSAEAPTDQEPRRRRRA